MQKPSLKFILLLVLVTGLMFLVFRPFAYMIAIALGITLSVVGLVYLVQFISKMYRKFKIRNSMEGIIEEKIAVINKQIEVLHKELSTIKVELEDLKVQLQNGGHSKFTEDKLVRLQDEFEIEQDLKEQKIQFYELTAKRYMELLADQRVLKKISHKKVKLREVRNERQTALPTEDHLSSDKVVIEELDYLTLRMENTVHIDEARDIQKELIELYR